jgi:hypothetical protein
MGWGVGGGGGQLMKLTWSEFLAAGPNEGGGDKEHDLAIWFGISDRY